MGLERRPNICDECAERFAWTPWEEEFPPEWEDGGYEAEMDAQKEADRYHGRT